MRFVAAAIAVVALVSCSRDPNVVKRKYLESGNKYFARGKYREASIMYRNALKTDQLFGEAYYRLALTQLRTGQLAGALGSLQRAADLIPESQTEHWDASVKLAEIYIAAGRDLTAAAQKKQFLDEAENVATKLLKRDPNSFDGHRLTADLAFVRAEASFNTGERDKGRELLATAVEEYRKANSVKPGEEHLMLSLAKALTVSRQFDEAEKLYKQVVDRNKAMAIAYTELYNLYLIENRPNEGEKLLKAAIANNPKQYLFLSLLAAHYYGMKRRDDVVRVLGEIKSHAKEFSQAYLTAGDFYLRMGEPEEAIKQYKEGIANDTKQKVTYQKRIIEVLMRQGKRTEAAELNSEILKSNPKDNDAHALSAWLMLDKGEVQKAIAELQAVVTSAPDNFVARYNLGRAHLAQGEREQARQQFAESSRLKPDYLPPRVALAQLQLTNGEYEGALKSAGDILKLDPQNGPARLIQSAALMRTNRVGESRQLLEGMLRTNPSSPDVVFQLGTANLVEKKYKEAEEAFRRAYQLNPANSRGLLGVVETYLAQNKTQQAIDTLQDELSKHPDRLDVRLALGNTAVRLGKFDLALSQFEKVLSAVPKNTRAAGDLYFRIGETYRRKGDLNNAVIAFQKAREILPESAIAASGLAQTLDAAHRKPEARQAYEQALKLNPRDAVALNNLAYLLAETDGDLNEALTLAQRAKQILPNMLEVSDTLGVIYLKKNLNDNALQIFRDLVAKQPSHPTYRYHLGVALSKRGDKLQAVKELQQALKDNPSQEEQSRIRELLEKLG